jgi:hypothetical protein
MISRTPRMMRAPLGPGCGTVARHCLSKWRRHLTVTGDYRGISPSFTIRGLRQEPWKHRCTTNYSDGKLTNCNPTGQAVGYTDNTSSAAASTSAGWAT